jgi:hypothetical protein
MASGNPPHAGARPKRRAPEGKAKKVRRYFQRGDNMACALGAAAAGAGKRRPKRPGTWWNSLAEVFPELDDKVIHPRTGERMNLDEAIVSLNDDTAYSREAIADWLCWLGGCRHEFSEPEADKHKHPARLAGKFPGSIAHFG